MKNTTKCILVEDPKICVSVRRGRIILWNFIRLMLKSNSPYEEHTFFCLSNRFVLTSLIPRPFLPGEALYDDNQRISRNCKQEKVWKSVSNICIGKREYRKFTINFGCVTLSIEAFGNISYKIKINTLANIAHCILRNIEKKNAKLLSGPPESPRTKTPLQSSPERKCLRWGDCHWISQ